MNNQALALRTLSELAKVVRIYDDKGRPAKHTIFDGLTGKTIKVDELRVERRKIIFAQFKGNDNLKKALEVFAIELSLIIYWGRPGYPDLISIPSAALILDGGAIGVRNWDAFLEYRAADHKSPCFVVTDRVFRRPLGTVYEFRLDDIKTPENLIDKLSRYF